MITLGGKIKEYRLLFNESQKDLADLLNVSFQTISKWENNIYLPDLQQIKDLANHYHVSIDYLLDNQNAIDLVKKEFDVSINEEGVLSIWTDFEINKKISPISKLDSNRHRTNATEIYNATENKNTIIIAVDENGRIIFAWVYEGFFYGPDAQFYHDENNEGKKQCFILMDNYHPFNFRNRNEKNYLNCEFVIPKNGFLIIGKIDSLKTFELIRTIVPNIPSTNCFFDRNSSDCSNFYNHRTGQRLFGNVLLNGELDNVLLNLTNNKLVVSVEKTNSERIFIYSSDFIDIKKYIIDQISNKVEETNLELKKSIYSRIDELEDKVDDLESSIDDLDAINNENNQKE